MNDTQANPSPEELQAAIDRWVQKAQHRVDQNNAGHPFPPNQIICDRGPRYLKVQSRAVRTQPSGANVVAESGSAFAFIDLKGGTVQGVPSKIGDVYKPDGCKGPAKWARGNIFDSDSSFGMQYVGPYGVQNLR